MPVPAGSTGSVGWMVQTVGIRTVEVRGNEFLINGEPF